MTGGLQVWTMARPPSLESVRTSGVIEALGRFHMGFAPALDQGGRAGIEAHVLR